MADIDYEASISTPSGWLVLDDEAAGYESEGESTMERTVSYRQRTISGDWVEGEFVTASVRGNVVEPLHVWVTAPDPAELVARVAALTDALEQLTYSVRLRWATHEETWTCMPAGYTVTTSREFRVATTALVKAQVPRLPGRTVARLAAPVAGPDPALALASGPASVEGAEHTWTWGAAALATTYTGAAVSGADHTWFWQGGSS